MTRPAPTATPAPKKPGRVRRFFEGLDAVAQLTEAVVAVGRIGALLVRGVLHVFRIFD